MQIEIRKPLITFSSSTNPLLPSLPLHTPYYLLFLYKPLITFSSFTNHLLPSLPLRDAQITAQHFIILISYM